MDDKRVKLIYLFILIIKDKYVMFYNDIYLYLAQYLTPYETKQLVMTCQAASYLRQVKFRKRLEYNVECRPYYPKKYAKEIYKKEKKKYKNEFINERIFFRGDDVGYIWKYSDLHSWYFWYTGKLMKPWSMMRKYLKEVNLHMLNKEEEGDRLIYYLPDITYYALKELAIHDFLTFCKWMANRQN